MVCGCPLVCSWQQFLKHMDWAFLNGEKAEYFFIKQKGMTDGLCHNSVGLQGREADIFQQGAVECSVGKRHLVTVHICSARVLCAPDSHHAGSRLSA